MKGIYNPEYYQKYKDCIKKAKKKYSLKNKDKINEISKEYYLKSKYLPEKLKYYPSFFVEQKGFVCDICSEVLQTNGKLKEHTDKIHPKNKNISNCNTYTVLN